MSEMNARLEIASRLMAGMRRGIYPIDELTQLALREADALTAEEARTRPPAADAPAPDDTPRQTVAERVLCGLKQLADDVEDSIKTSKTLVQVKGKPHLVPAKVADEIAELRAVAEEMLVALDHACEWLANDHDRVHVAGENALARARAMGLGGGK